MLYWFLICVSFPKELAAWVRNNWRPYSTTIETKPNIKITAINVVWQTQKAAVEDMIKEILGVDELDRKDPRYFQQRTAAAKRVLEEMTEQERTAINQIVEERRAEGNPENIRREYVRLALQFPIPLNSHLDGLKNIVKGTCKLGPGTGGWTWDLLL
jgi:hypothetical protein